VVGGDESSEAPRSRYCVAGVTSVRANSFGGRVASTLNRFKLTATWRCGRTESLPAHCVFSIAQTDPPRPRAAEQLGWVQHEVRREVACSGKEAAPAGCRGHGGCPCPRSGRLPRRRGDEGAFTKPGLPVAGIPGWHPITRWGQTSKSSSRPVDSNRSTCSGTDLRAQDDTAAGTSTPPLREFTSRAVGDQPVGGQSSFYRVTGNKPFPRGNGRATPTRETFLTGRWHRLACRPKGLHDGRQCDSWPFDVGRFRQ